MIRDHTKGFTLIELVVVLVLFGVISGLVGTLLVNMSTLRGTINEGFEEDSDVVSVLEKISNDIRFEKLDCDDIRVRVEKKTGNVTYEYGESDDGKFDMLTNVQAFSCKNISEDLEISEDLKLYELTIKLETETYRSRAYQRD